MFKSHFSFDEFLRGVVHDFEFKAEMEHKKFNIKKNSEEIYVYADQDKCEKILNNLLSNALKHTKEQDTITIKYYQEADNLLVEVTDTGRGIDAVDLPHIFERFYQSHSGKNIYSGGSGIGLAFTKRLVEMHYGSISYNFV